MCYARGGENFFATGSGRGTVNFYPACYLPMTPVDRVIQEVANNLMSLVHKTVENGLALLPGSQGKKFNKFPVHMVLMAPGSNSAYGNHTDFNVTNGRMDNESYEDVNLPTRGQLMTLTVIWESPGHPASGATTSERLLL